LFSAELAPTPMVSSEILPQSFTRIPPLLAQLVPVWNLQKQSFLIACAFKEIIPNIQMTKYFIFALLTYCIAFEAVISGDDLKTHLCLISSS
jgi:hypothetical protein